MLNLKNEKSPIYRKGILVVQLVVILSIVLTIIFDDTAFDSLLRGLWILSVSTWGILEGIKTAVAKQNKAGYLYFIGVAIFLLSIIIYMYSMMN